MKKNKFLLISFLFVLSFLFLLNVNAETKKEPIVICPNNSEYVSLDYKDKMGVFKLDVFKNPKTGVEYIGLNKNERIINPSGGCFKYVSAVNYYSKTFIELGRFHIIRQRFTDNSMQNVADAVALYNCSSVVNESCDNSSYMGYIMNSIANIVYEQIYKGKATRLTTNTQYRFRKDVSNYIFNFPKVSFGQSETNKFEVPIKIIDLLVMGYKEMENPTTNIDLGIKRNILTKEKVNEKDLKIKIELKNQSDNYDMDNIHKVEFIFGGMLVQDVKEVSISKKEKVYEFIIPEIYNSTECHKYELQTVITKKNDLRAYAGFFFGSIYTNGQGLIENITDEDVKKLTSGDIRGTFRDIINVGSVACDLGNKESTLNKDEPTQTITINDLKKNTILAGGEPARTSTRIEIKIEEVIPVVPDWIIVGKEEEAVYRDGKWIVIPKTPIPPLRRTPTPLKPNPVHKSSCFSGYDSLLLRYRRNPSVYADAFKPCCNEPNAEAQMGSVIYDRLCVEFIPSRCGEVGNFLECKKEPGKGFIYEAKQKGVTIDNLHCLLQSPRYVKSAETYCTVSCKDDVDIYHQGWGYNPETVFAIKSGQYFKFRPYLIGDESANNLPKIDQERNCVYKADTEQFTQDLFGEEVDVHGVNNHITRRRYIGGYYAEAERLLTEIYELKALIAKYEYKITLIEESPCGDIPYIASNDSNSNDKNKVTEKTIETEDKIANSTEYIPTIDLLPENKNKIAMFDNLTQTKDDVKKKYRNATATEIYNTVPSWYLIDSYFQWGRMSLDIVSECCCKVTDFEHEYRYSAGPYDNCPQGVTDYTKSQYVSSICINESGVSRWLVRYRYCENTRTVTQLPESAIYYNTENYNNWPARYNLVSKTKKDDSSKADGTIVTDMFNQTSITKYVHVSELVTDTKTPTENKKADGTIEYTCPKGYTLKERKDGTHYCWKSTTETWVEERLYTRVCKCAGKKFPNPLPCTEIKEVKINILVELIGELTIQIDTLMTEYVNVIELIDEAIAKYSGCLKLEYGYEPTDVPQAENFYYDEQEIKDSEYKELVGSIKLEYAEPPVLEIDPIDYCEESRTSLDCGKLPEMVRFPKYARTLEKVTYGEVYEEYRNDHVEFTEPIEVYDIANKSSNVSVSYQLDKDIVTIKPTGAVTSPDNPKYVRALEKNLYNYVGRGLPVSIKTLESEYDYSFRITNLGKNGDLDPLFISMNNGDVYNCVYHVVNEITIPPDVEEEENKCFAGPESLRGKYNNDPVKYHEAYKNDCCKESKAEVEMGLNSKGESIYEVLCLEKTDCFIGSPSLKEKYTDDQVTYESEYKNKCCGQPDARTNMGELVYVKLCTTTKPLSECFEGPDSYKERYKSNPEKYAVEYATMCCIFADSILEENMGITDYYKLCAPRIIKCPPGNVCDPPAYIKCPPGMVCGVTNDLGIYPRRIDMLKVNPTNRVLGANWTTELGKKTINVIEEKANYMYLEEPLYEFSLDSVMHKEILEDNRLNGYYSFEFECDDQGNNCRSDFVKKFADKTTSKGLEVGVDFKLILDDSE